MNTIDGEATAELSMSFLDNVTPGWIEEQYLLWKESPGRLNPEWAAFFSGFEVGRSTAGDSETSAAEAAMKTAAVQALIHRYRDMGHLLACTDPLTPCKTDHPLLRPRIFGLDASDTDKTFPTDLFATGRSTLRDILAFLQETYCRSIGVEFMHIQEPEMWQWVVERMEISRNRTSFSADEKLRILRGLQEANLFERFLHRNFPGQTRFSLEGGETLIPLLDAAVSHAARLGFTDIVLGMPHRGRLNIQANILGKPLENIFAEFRDEGYAGFVGDGDVKYHGGFSTDLETESGARIHVTLAANPSHLEAIDPVVEGKSRARQDRLGRNGAERVLPLLIHGDAAFSGQGIVAETLNMSLLEGYGTGGTLHIVLNNQIGFTTLPADARSTRYATDVARMLTAPIFHVHCEDPEAAIHAVRLALDFRRTFARDTVLELICYRRYGHNEGDEPYFTQPLMYEKIKGRPPIHEFYGTLLMEEGLPAEEIQRSMDEIAVRLDSAKSREGSVSGTAFLGHWSGFQREFAPTKIETGVARDTLLSLAGTLSELPPDFTPHPKIAALLQKRRTAVASGEGIDWANAETLAFASLLHEGTPVRLSGQDCRRGTFSQRHCVLHDIRTEELFTPLAAVAAENAAFSPYDSLLSEAAVLGFEYGYTLESPETLTLWEAQYGDFSNGAQVIIDQFIASGETKWGRASGLVMLLPHGYEGHGAEHSSARPERFLQLCADANIQVAFPSTPAQYFHLLRRQARQPFRKPLVILTPKSLLRSSLCLSRLDEFSSGWFRELLPSSADPEKVAAVLVCSGKLYFELAERRRRDNRDDTAIIRIEQLYPLRSDLLREELGRFRNARRFAWVQEEPANMGAWSHMRPFLAEILGSDPVYAGRREGAAPAVGSLRLHKEEQERVLEEAFAG
jgi:2-oxoglutarate dehydrogenase E1 component